MKLALLGYRSHNLLEKNLLFRVNTNRTAENLADGKAHEANCEPFASAAALPITSKGPSECTFLLHRTHAR